MLIFTTDKTRLLKHFRKDPVLFAYHIADLDDQFFPNCQWGVSHKSYTQLEEVILIYHGLSIPVVHCFGLTKAFDSLLEEIFDLLPNKFFCHYQKERRTILDTAFSVSSLGIFQKMKLETFHPMKQPPSDVTVILLTDAHTSEVEAFYKLAYPNGYFDPAMLATKKYYGAIKEDKLVAIAGVHAISDEHKIAVLGNIATLPEERGKGYSQVVTSALVDVLAKEGKLVALNADTENAAAIRVYEKLGFVRTHEYEEAIVTRR